MLSERAGRVRREFLLERGLGKPARERVRQCAVSDVVGTLVGVAAFRARRFEGALGHREASLGR
jgi:hypothetical protein